MDKSINIVLSSNFLLSLTFANTTPGSSIETVNTFVVHLGVSSLTSITLIVTDAVSLRGDVPPSVAVTVRMYWVVDSKSRLSDNTIAPVSVLMVNSPLLLPAAELNVQAYISIPFISNI